MSKEDIAKLRILLKHWAEHNREHSQEFIAWADKAKLSGEAEAGEKMMAAAAEMDKSSDLLRQALKKLWEK